MGIKTSKNILLPKADDIRDPETKRVVQQILRVIQKMNQSISGDLAGHEERITDLEP